MPIYERQYFLRSIIEIQEEMERIRERDLNDARTKGR